MRERQQLYTREKELLCPAALFLAADVGAYASLIECFVRWSRLHQPGMRMGHASNFQRPPYMRIKSHFALRSMVMQGRAKTVRPVESKLRQQAGP